MDIEQMSRNHRFQIGDRVVCRGSFCEITRIENHSDGRTSFYGRKVLRDGNLDKNEFHLSLNLCVSPSSCRGN